MLKTGLADNPFFYYTLRALIGSYLVSDFREVVALRWPAVMSRLLSLSIDEKYVSSGLLFIHVPKAAGTSVSQALFGTYSEHHTALYYRALDPKLFQKLESFAVIRDPFDRTISAYKHVRSGGGEDRALHPGWRNKLTKVKSLTDYLHYVKDHKDSLFDLDTVMRPQCHFVCDQTGNVLVRRLFRLESTRFREFLASHGVRRLPTINVTRASSPIATSLDRTLIEQLYEKDFNLFEQLAES